LTEVVEETAFAAFRQPSLANGWKVARVAAKTIGTFRIGVAGLSTDGQVLTLLRHGIASQPGGALAEQADLIATG
jgi:hypothetical protein